MAVAAQRRQDHLLLARLLGRPASRTEAAKAWVGSGAGTIPSVRAKVTPASKHSVWWMAIGLDQSQLVDVGDQGDMPW